MPRLRAMPLLGSPWATSWSTWSSRAVSGSVSGAGAANEAGTASEVDAIGRSSSTSPASAERTARSS